MSLQSVGAGVTGHAVNTSDYAGSSRQLLGSIPTRSSHQYSGTSGLDFGSSGGRLGMSYGGSGGHSHHSGGGSSAYLPMSAPASLSGNHPFGSHSLNGAGAGGGGGSAHHSSALYSSSHHHSQAPPPLHQPHHPSQPQHPHQQSLPPSYLPSPSQGPDSRLASADPGPHAHGYYGES